MLFFYSHLHATGVVVVSSPLGSIQGYFYAYPYKIVCLYIVKSHTIHRGGALKKKVSKTRLDPYAHTHNITHIHTYKYTYYYTHIYTYMYT